MTDLLTLSGRPQYTWIVLRLFQAIDAHSGCVSVSAAPLASEAAR